MTKGVSLLETVVVIAIIAILALFGVNTINSFRKDASIDNAANELVSDIRLARSKSMNGELIAGESEDDFTEDGLPRYGLTIAADNYRLVRECTKEDGSTCSSEPPIQAVKVGPQYTLVPLGSFYFERITGISGGRVITITEASGRGRQISVSADFVITVTKI